MKIQQHPSSPTKDRGGGAKEGQRGMTLISKQWHVALPVAILVYALLESILGSNEAFCSKGQQPFEIWAVHVNFIVAACFMLSAFHNATMATLMGSFFNKHMDYPRSAYAASATVSLVAGISSIVSLTKGKTHICKDVFGIETYHAQWAEWLVAMPLIGYIAIAVEDKDALNREDILVIVLMFLTILFGFVMNVSHSSHSKHQLGWGFFSISCICYLGNIVMAASAWSKVRESSTTDKGVVHSGWKLGRSVLKYRLSLMLLLVLPIFPIIYLLRYFHIISR
jgi:hypothetical protein